MNTLFLPSGMWENRDWQEFDEDRYNGWSSHHAYMQDQQIMKAAFTFIALWSVFLALDSHVAVLASSQCL